jgi:hypothetical protein
MLPSAPSTKPRPRIRQLSVELWPNRCGFEAAQHSGYHLIVSHAGYFGERSLHYRRDRCIRVKRPSSLSGTSTNALCHGVACGRRGLGHAASDGPTSGGCQRRRSRKGRLRMKRRLLSATALAMCLSMHRVCSQRTVVNDRRGSIRAGRLTVADRPEVHGQRCPHSGYSPTGIPSPI